MSGHYLREAEIPARENWRKRSSSETTTSDLADFCKSLILEYLDSYARIQSTGWSFYA